MSPEKKVARRTRNQFMKQVKARAKQADLAQVGKLVFERVTDIDIEAVGEDGKNVITKKTVLDFPPAIRTSRDGSILPLEEPTQMPSRVAGYGSTSLLFLAAKQHKQSGVSMRNRPMNNELHGAAVIENASRSLATEIDKALAPAEAVDIPVIPVNAAEEVSNL